jgi:glucan 1,3-beta-glucosidase
MSFNPSHLFDLESFLHQNEFLNFDSVESLSELELRRMFLKILNDGVHGFCFSIYEEGQKPGDIITKNQVQRRIQILKPHCQWIRSFSCIEGNEFVPLVAKEFGMQTLVGAWLSNDIEKNEEEIEALIDLGNKGLVDIAAVGNEVLYRNDLSLEQLIGYMQRVKQALHHVPIGYVDAYYEFTLHPELIERSDILLINCYPFWEGTPSEYSIAHMKSMYHQVKEVSQGKKVLISETGWPFQGQELKSSIPSTINALNYFVETHLWAKSEGIETFYFSSFDESWKTGPEGDLGAHWGIWDKNEKLKFTDSINV